jgi:hypothetical protein
VLSSIAVFPHSLSYFNEFVGGPYGGPRHVLGSNVDWGQDLFYIDEWVKRHPSAKPLFIEYSLKRYVDPGVLGVQYETVPVMPVPGWYMLSVNYLYGEGKEGSVYRRLKPIDSIGYSMYVYHISSDDAKAIRESY